MAHYLSCSLANIKLNLSLDSKHEMQHKPILVGKPSYLDRSAVPNMSISNAENLSKDNTSSLKQPSLKSLSATKKKAMSEIEKLEMDNQRMEERLREFRESISRQKAKRAIPANRESLWSGGDTTRGSLTQYASDVLVKKNAAIKAKRFSGVAQEADEKRKALDQIHRHQPSIMGVEQTMHLKQNCSMSSSPIPVPPQSDRPQKPTGGRRTPQRLWKVDNIIQQSDASTNQADTMQKLESRLDDIKLRDSDASTPLVSLPNDLLCDGWADTTHNTRPRRQYIPPTYINQNLQHSDISTSASSVNDTQPHTGINLATSQRHVSFKEEMNETHEYTDYVLDDSNHDLMSGIQSDQSITKLEAQSYMGGSSLFDGEYDEEANQTAFLNALLEWRNEGKQKDPAHALSSHNQPMISKNIDATNTELSTPKGTSTAPVKKLTIEERVLQVKTQLKTPNRPTTGSEGMSYMDKLLLSEMRQRSRTQSEPKLTLEKTDQVFDDLKKIDGTDDEEDMDDDAVLEMIRNYQIRKSVKSQLQTPPTRTVKSNLGDIVIQDITHKEEEEILKSLDQGRVVEIIPITSPLVIMPDDQ
ncbi:hypothetical protein BDEG_20760 [Batrachochytrium dendrobatidis JEL423]|uniref:Uncharacterized protein n=1 Tax=Batrachochytrium dendrobatidis (strain JEL423) TaxID=403673 RepID=A0A177WA55_BATDL|nr:hypothetical protein BDEG_20760 [Batrachochytrium dendrobatidis JEL423]